MKRLFLALSMLAILPLFPASKRATLQVTTVAACEMGQLGNTCDAERPNNHRKLGQPSDYRFRLEVGPVGDIVFTLLTSLIRL